MRTLQNLTNRLTKTVVPTARRRTSQRSQPTEALEERVLLSNVTVNFTGGDLVLQGDSDDNKVSVEQVANGIQVTGHSGTTINGRLSMLIRAVSVPDDLRANFSAGGNNTLAVENLVVGDDVQYRGGRGRESFAVIEGEVRGDVNIRTGNGADAAVLSSVLMDGEIAINTGSGSDRVVVGGEEISADININTGRGRDDVFLASMSAGDVVVKTGGGNDIAFIVQVEADEMNMNMGGGNDEVAMGEVDVSARMTVKGGGGSDNYETIAVSAGDERVSQFEGNTVTGLDDRIEDLSADLEIIFAELA
ncbi:MAG: hypothetical protein AB8G99_03045 [Planctomycetaceae bacterium]